jgi:hypothetical protein
MVNTSHGAHSIACSVQWKELAGQRHRKLMVLLGISLALLASQDRDQSSRLGLFLTFEATEGVYPIGETEA